MITFGLIHRGTAGAIGGVYVIYVWGVTQIRGLLIITIIDQKTNMFDLWV